MSIGRFVTRALARGRHISLKLIKLIFHERSFVS